MKKLKKKQKNILMTIALAGGTAYFVRTFPLGDSILGGVIGSAFGHPVIGAVTGLLVPSRDPILGKTLSILADSDPFGPITEGIAGAMPNMAPNGAEM